MEAGGERAAQARGHVTVIEDEASISDPLRSALEREGYAVSVEATGSGGLDSVRANEPDIVLLDLMLPDLDGRDVCRAIRQSSEVPIIMLTARGLETDRVVGLELGADDYVVKPVGLRELVARIRAVTRRGRAQRHGHETLAVGALEVDIPARRANLAGRELALTVKEFDLLALLASHPDVVVGRPEILREVWGTTWYGSSKTVDVHVASLRKKLGDPTLIETVRGVGLRLRA
jgi:two-component system response regulator RegX3